MKYIMINKIENIICLIVYSNYLLMLYVSQISFSKNYTPDGHISDMVQCGTIYHNLVQV